MDLLCFIEKKCRNNYKMYIASMDRLKAVGVNRKGSLIVSDKGSLFYHNAISVSDDGRVQKVSVVGNDVAL